MCDKDRCNGRWWIFRSLSNQSTRTLEHNLRQNAVITVAFACNIMFHHIICISRLQWTRTKKNYACCKLHSYGNDWRWKCSNRKHAYIFSHSRMRIVHTIEPYTHMTRVHMFNTKWRALFNFISFQYSFGGSTALALPRHVIVPLFMPSNCTKKINI